MSPPGCVPLYGTTEAKTDALAALAARWSRSPLVRKLVAGKPLALLLATVQHLPYVADSTPDVDEVCDPSVILSRGGDCEDRAALFAALAQAGGWRVRLVWQEQEGDQDHVTAEVWLGGAWQWCDATVPGAQIGEEPHDAAERTGYMTRLKGA